MLRPYRAALNRAPNRRASTPSSNTRTMIAPTRQESRVQTGDVLKKHRQRKSCAMGPDIVRADHLDECVRNTFEGRLRQAYGNRKAQTTCEGISSR
jgi:hypothetical protein